jgi:hypothetical protein
VDERIELGQVDAGERAADRESLALEAARRGRHGTDAAPGGGGSDLRESLQCRDVVNGDGWHGVVPPSRFP